MFSSVTGSGMVLVKPDGPHRQRLLEFRCRSSAGWYPPGQCIRYHRRVELSRLSHYSTVWTASRWHTSQTVRPLVVSAKSQSSPCYMLRRGKVIMDHVVYMLKRIACQTVAFVRFTVLLVYFIYYICPVFYVLNSLQFIFKAELSPTAFCCIFANLIQKPIHYKSGPFGMHMRVYFLYKN